MRVVLKNVGLICVPCGAGRHYDCDTIADPTKKMCLCVFTVHPYLSKSQLEKPISAIVSTAVGVEAQQSLAPSVVPTEDAAASARFRLPKK